MAYNDRQIKIDTSKRELNDRVKNFITSTDDQVFWYIKFNLPLDEQSISKKTMKVTDTNGVIIKTDIVFNKSLELITISPIENYEKDEYYILHINKKVRSQNLQNLKKDIHILFKLKDGQLVDFKELGENIKVPKPKMDFSTSFNIKRRAKTNLRVYDFSEEQKKKLEEARNKDGKLPYVNLRINPIIALIGTIVFFISSILGRNVLATIGVFIAVIGFIILIAQMQSQEIKSNFFYNLGVISFNKGKYNKAKKRFEKALNINNDNELAEYAMNKSLFYM